MEKCPHTHKNLVVSVTRRSSADARKDVEIWRRSKRSYGSKVKARSWVFSIFSPFPWPRPPLREKNKKTNKKKIKIKNKKAPKNKNLTNTCGKNKKTRVAKWKQQTLVYSRISRISRKPKCFSEFYSLSLTPNPKCEKKRGKAPKKYNLNTCGNTGDQVWTNKPWFTRTVPLPSLVFVFGHSHWLLFDVHCYRLGVTQSRVSWAHIWISITITK